MDIQIDTREKQRAIRKIIKTFDENGVKHFSSKLLVGDYMSLDNPRLIIDRKQNLQELCGNVCQQHERFKKELLKAIDAGIQLVILVEHGSDVKNLEDVWFWQNPRKHEVRWRMINGKRENMWCQPKRLTENSCINPCVPSGIGTMSGLNSVRRKTQARRLCVFCLNTVMQNDARGNQAGILYEGYSGQMWAS